MGQLVAEFTNMKGEAKKFFLPELSTKNYHKIMFTAGVTVMAALADIGKAAAVSYDQFIFVAKSLLDGMVVDGVGTIDDVETHGYFRKNPDELYLGTLHALRANYPELFLRLAAKFSKSDFARQVGAVKLESEKPMSPSPTGNGE